MSHLDTYMTESGRMNVDAIPPGIMTDVMRLQQAVLYEASLDASRSLSTYRDVVVAGIPLLAFVGATDEQATAMAHMLADQLQGSEDEMRMTIGGVEVELVADEPVDGRMNVIYDATAIRFDGETVISLLNRRGLLNEASADWEALNLARERVAAA